MTKTNRIIDAGVSIDMSAGINKFSRQLMVFAKFYTAFGGIELDDIKTIVPNINQRTLNRDLDDLKRAGLIDIAYDRKEKSYIRKSGGRFYCPYLPVQYMANAARNMHLDKLIRLVKFMEWTLGNTAPSKESYTSWYKKAFPGLSERTMKRDVRELEKIGIYICHEYLEEFDTDNEKVLGAGNAISNIMYEHLPNCYYVNLCEFQSVIDLDCW